VVTLLKIWFRVRVLLARGRWSRPRLGFRNFTIFFELRNSPKGLNYEISAKISPSIMGRRYSPWVRV
jgi:hypothetical protein